MTKARIEYEEDTTSRLYRLKRWYAHNHWNVKDSIKTLTLILMCVPLGYLIGAFLLFLLYVYPVVFGVITACVMAFIAVIVKLNN